MSEEVRASDGERGETIERLQTAHVEGRISEEEISQRVAAALQARTRGELQRLTADLPAPTAAPSPDRAREVQDHRKDLTAWGAASAVTFVIWAITALTAGEWLYPWFLWVVGPWGAVLLVKTIADRG